VETGLAAELELSRRRLLAAIGETSDLTFVRGIGNVGDELIMAGTRRLLAGLPFREAALQEAVQRTGHTAVISGSGAWCQPYHEVLPQALPRLEQRFERVVLLPSSFDLSVGPVRHALGRTRAVVFARELESLRQVREVCAAEVAHDGAFFFDYTPYEMEGAGTLLAFRTDAEAAGGPLPAGNLDISATCSSLDEWLWTIARHQTVLTDRAHVMIAAALLGKRVEYRPSSYHKVGALAAFALAGCDVRRLEGPLASPVAPVAMSAPEAPAVTAQRRRAGAMMGGAAPAIPPTAPAPAAPAASAAPLEDTAEQVRARLLARARRNLDLLPAALVAGQGEPRLTLVVVSHDRPQHWPRLFQSIRDHVRLPTRLLVLDNASPPAARGQLRRLCGALAAAREAGAVELQELDRNLGCGAARQRALAGVTTEYLMLLDDDAELLPGAVEHLVAVLDADPAVVAAGAHVVLADGTTQFCGGEYWEVPDGVLHFEPLGHGLDFEDPALGGARACQWLGGTAVALRRSALERDPFDPGMAWYYEDNEWFYRVGRCRPDAAFQRSVAALVLHHQELKGPRCAGAEELEASLPYLQSIAHFQKAHGLPLEGVFVFAPWLCGGGRRDAAAARLALDLLSQHGPEWFAAAWRRGDLEPLRRIGCAVDLAARTTALDATQKALTAVQTELEAARGELEAARGGLVQAHRELATVYGSRLWRGADLYWRLRRWLAGRGGERR
jgi:hypothetical protein